MRAVASEPLSTPALEIPRDALAALCRRHRIAELALFGSVLRSDFSPGSDIDMVVRFEPGATPGLRMVRIADEISALVEGRPVDLRLEEELHPRFRDAVLEGRHVVYRAP